MSQAFFDKFAIEGVIVTAVLETFGIVGQLAAADKLEAFLQQQQITPNTTSRASTLEHLLAKDGSLCLDLACSIVDSTTIKR